MTVVANQIVDAKKLAEYFLLFEEDYVINKTPVSKINQFAIFQSNTSNSVDTESELSSLELAESATDLEVLRSIVQQYNGCRLKDAALNTVFADGNADADIMIIGEAPGAQEDKYGIPFCGQSGKLLDNMLLSIDIPRSKAYITNTVFWRPPGNRRPTNEEIAICRPFVEKHIALLKPKLIVLVGATAVESLLDITDTMHELRGKVFEYQNKYLNSSIPAVVIFHPSYLLRQPSKKKLMWFDLLHIRKLLVA